jgi:lysozyme
MNEKIKKRLKDQLKLHEGVKHKVYKCPAGHNTIGVGWNLDSNALPLYIKEYLNKNGEITDPMIEVLLDRSVDNAIADCRSLYINYDKFSEDRQIALANFLFNVGLSVALDFKKANKYINEENWSLAALELKDSKWYKQTGCRSLELVSMILGG